MLHDIFKGNVLAALSVYLVINLTRVCSFFRALLLYVYLRSKVDLRSSPFDTLLSYFATCFLLQNSN